MSSPEEPSKSEIRARVRELLGQATLARMRGQREQAVKLAREAVALDAEDAEAHELEGDLLLELRRGEEAMSCFRRARELNPSRAVLEDKIARAALEQAKLRDTVALSQALLEGTARRATSRRSPGAAAVLSFLAPGLGQLYNGEVWKGLVMLMVYLALALMAILAVLREVAARGGGMWGAYGARLDASEAVSALFAGPTSVATLVLLGLWIYSIADAALRASRTMTHDDTGVV